MSDPTESAASPFSRPATKAVTPSVLVTGDLVWNHHIARLPSPASGYHQPHLQTRLAIRHGGAWQLEKLVGLALRSVGIEAEVDSPARAADGDPDDQSAPGGIAKAFSLWERYFESHGDAAWRIQEFLGCEPADWQKNPRQTPDPSAATPTLVAIDDLGLGFADHPDAWPACLGGEPAGGPRFIVAKSAPPFDRPLWKKLLQPAWAERLTVVLSASALREAGAKLSIGRSWDLTIEEVQRVFSNGGTGWPLRYCKRVILTFGKSGAAVFSRRPQTPAEIAEPPSELKFERFVFDPTSLESTSPAQFAGPTLAPVAALQVVHELLPLPPSSHLTVSRGLDSARVLHRLGGGLDPRLIDLDSAENICFTQNPEPEKYFRSAYARRLLDEPVLVTRDQMHEPSLLTDALGNSPQFLTVAAEKIVRFGKEKLLAEIPHFACGDFFTADREEIEQLNTLRNLILDYQSNPGDTRPLSLAVFGEPGTGKTFAFKQLIASHFGKEKSVLEFDLSQFPDLNSLQDAFHQIRDDSAQGRNPFVFWDGIDSTRDGLKLGWLKEFLVPVQDAHFVSKGKTHPFGKCVFIFTGGASAKFSDFDSAAKDMGAEATEFVSSLCGFANIRGLNPEGDKGDQAYIIRRALLLRALIQRAHPSTIRGETGELAITPQVLSAFLKVEKYHLGARSMEAIIRLSRFGAARQFGPSELPPPEIAQLHVSPDFSHLASSQDGVTIGPVEIDQLAAIMHKNWVKSKVKDGWTKGDAEGRNASAKTDSRLVGFHELKNDADKEAKRKPAMLTLLRLEAMGYQIIRRELQWGEHQVDLTEESDSLEQFARSEHRRWMREKLLAGFSFAEHTSDELQLHEDLRHFDLLPLARRNLDHSVVNAFTDFLNDKGLTLVRGKTT